MKNIVGDVAKDDHQGGEEIKQEQELNDNSIQCII
jgi:hypothetical protein